MSTSSLSIVIAARNEAGNISALFDEIPVPCQHTQVIVVEGNSTDDTWATLQAVHQQYQKKWSDITLLQQDGTGKADAVWKGIAHATGDIILIYDADRTVDAATITDLYNAMTEPDVQFVYGSRLILPREKAAMRLCNTIGNHFFAAIWSHLLQQRISDTLCGSKAFYREDIQRFHQEFAPYIASDPYADFSFLLMAAVYHLPMQEIAVRYRARTYGQPNISRWRDGLQLAKLSLHARRIIQEQRRKTL